MEKSHGKPPKVDQKRLAKCIIVEIVRKLKLPHIDIVQLSHKFYEAHMECVRRNSHYLSVWPIVKGTRGPAIYGVKGLLDELLRERTLRRRMGDTHMLCMERYDGEGATLYAIPFHSANIFEQDTSTQHVQNAISAPWWDELEVGEDIMAHAYASLIPEAERKRIEKRVREYAAILNVPVRGDIST